ncbi:hypothetical protein SAMN05444156_1523 [Verrucomicrobium sp. GAS474]|uniref:hypothetical protein n=1 Tax=Verrucomicrobium sp. GAS474 TaxID=1882831 RepID=UPI00087A8465|nr:hypothetical protein [Verrucomicrobium sp. GAS474]SDU02649.1 hypothetical protein SAMN05444156_1523 [Verrucomicrobium sp. GAS474]
MNRLPSSQSRSGAALVVVLAFVALIVSVVVAFLSQSQLQHQVSQSSANDTSAEILARGALNIVVGDVRQEILANSTASTVGQTTLYIPNGAANVVPTLVGSSGGAGVENLLKRSASGLAFYPGGPVRAAAAPSTTTSLNGRSVTRSRWNKPLLLTKANLNSSTDLSPIANFTAPDWILVDRTGRNPTAWSPALVTSKGGGTNALDESVAGSSSSVVGRYAYTVYNEGGLLDANVAGYPSASAPNGTGGIASFKTAESFADLTQIGLTQAQVNALVAWRNAASLNAQGSFPNLSVDTAATGQTNYFTLVSTNTSGFLSPPAATLSPTGSTDRLFVSRQNLIHFLVDGLGQGSSSSSASLQNSLRYLGTSIRAVNSPTWTPSSSRAKVQAGYAGQGLDDLFNPGILATRVTKTFVRDSDGTQAQIGEPLVKYRFPLSRLALFGNNNSAISSTTGDIYKYFGLTRSTAGATWVYNHGNTTKILRLSEVADAGREPDFFELLQAGILLGSLGQTFDNSFNDNINAYDYYVYNQIIQIGANLIDQYDTDSFPTVISLNSQEIYGVESLPYLIGIFNLVHRNNLATAPSFWYQPQIWNPQNTANAPTAGPTQFRYIVRVTSGANIYVSFVVNTTSPTVVWTTPSTSLSTADGVYFSSSASNSNFKLPVLLTQPTGGTAAGNNLVGDTPGNLGVWIGQCPDTNAADTYQQAVDKISASRVAHSLQYQNGTSWITYDQIKNIYGNLGHYCYDKYFNSDPAPHGYFNIRSDPRSDRFGALGSINNADPSGIPWVTPRPTASLNALYSHSGTKIPAPAGWTYGGPQPLTPATFYPGSLADNVTGSYTRYTDPDGVLRPGIGGYADGTLADGGYPMANDNANILHSRPVVLNRPFRSVADMGYASRGAPWKNIDFFHSTSADAALLDLFTVRPSPPVPIEAGRLDPNTRQIPVLQALLNGAIKEEAATPSTSLGTADAQAIAAKLVALSSITPLANPSELVTRWASGISYTTATDGIIKARRETAVRALADVANTRTWNLLIDLVAQTGRYPATAGNLNQFLVEGERRYWLHLSIDRYTGKIISQNIELVHE